MAELLSFDWGSKSPARSSSLLAAIDDVEFLSLPDG
jgi:hypothetical protein